jgi:hypothetical protein
LQEQLSLTGEALSFSYAFNEYYLPFSMKLMHYRRLLQ